MKGLMDGGLKVDEWIDRWRVEKDRCTRVKEGIDE